MARLRPPRSAQDTAPPASNTTQRKPNRRQLLRHASTSVGSTTPAAPTYQAFLAQARELALEGLKQVYEMATDPNSERWLRLSCWRVLFEYAYGKPKQTVQADIAHSFVLRAPELMLDADAWEAKWSEHLANDTLPAPSPGVSKPGSSN